MLETIGVAEQLAEPAARSARIAVADGLEPGGLHFDADDDEPLGWMHENRHLRAALQARAEAGQEHLAAVEIARDDGRPRRPWRGRSRSRTGASLQRAAADRRRRPQFGDARGRRNPRRALEIRPSGDRLGAPPRAAARPCRLRDFLSDRPVRAAADDRRCRRPSLGNRLVGAAGRCGRLAVAQRRGFRGRGRRRRWAAFSARSRCSRRARPFRSASTMRRRSPPGASRWSATPRTPFIRSPARA